MKSPLNKLHKQVSQIHQKIHDYLYHLLDDTSRNTKPKRTCGTKPPQPYQQPSPSKLSIMRGYLCTSFDDGDSLGIAIMAVAIDESHARQIISQELQKYRLRLEPHDELREIDLHKPGVTLVMSDSLAEGIRRNG
jgi:hypothetical protein